MNKQIPYLRLVTDATGEAAIGPAEDGAVFERMSRAFRRATGWQLEYSAAEIPLEKPNLMWSAPVNPGVGTSPGHIRLFSSCELDAEEPLVPLEQASLMADAIGQMWGELLATRHALYQREAELAASVPATVSPKQADALAMAERLEGVLRGGAEAIGCQAAALYVLDPATTELKLRSSWGLPRRRLTDPARPLRGAVADLEALMGHAIVIDDPQMLEYWRVPETGFGSYVCVPVSSPTMPLGTLWAFCRDARDFSDVQTNILEVVAGRLAADLERQVLVDEALVARDTTKQIAAAERSQQDQLPRIAPMIDGWEIAAKAYQAGPVGGTFYDWFSLDDGRLALLAGDAVSRGVEGALTAAALRAAARAFGTEPRSAHKLLEKVNSVLWSGSAGNGCAGMLQAIVEPGSDLIDLAAAGPMRVLAVTADGHTALAGPTSPLGLSEDVRLTSGRRILEPGELLIVYGTNFLTDIDPQTLTALDERLASTLEPRLSLPASQLTDIAGQILNSCPSLDTTDRVLLLVKRRFR